MLDVVNPANGQLIASLEEDSAEVIALKFREAETALSNWKEGSLNERKKIISRFNLLLQRNVERLSDLLTSEMGKPITQATSEIKAVAERIDFFMSHIDEMLQPKIVYHQESSQLTEEIIVEPLGVIGCISSWNYPYFIGTNVFIPALLCGNAVLYKPSELVPLTGLAMRDLFIEAGLASPLFQVLIGKSEVGASLIDLNLGGIFFTGSYATGLKIARRATDRLMKYQLELGGKDPTYVCDDADPLEAAESLAEGAFYNTGQGCCSVERIYVHQKIYEKFLDHFLHHVRSFKIGDPKDPGTYIGPLARQAQLAFLEDQIEDALLKEAKIELGGGRMGGENRGGNYFQPTILTGVDHRMKVMREESFGPIIGIQRVLNDDEAVSLMNDTDYGLTAGVYSKDGARARTILSKVNAATIYWNLCDRVSPRLPWTGRKRSGVGGATLSRYGIESFLQPKACHLKEVHFKF